MNYAPYYAPPSSLARIRIDRVNTLATLRLGILREFSHVKNVYDAGAQDYCITAYLDYSRKHPEIVTIMGDVELDALSFWILKLAFSSFDESAVWHMHAEQCLLMARSFDHWIASDKLLNGSIKVSLASEIDFGGAYDIADRYIQNDQNINCTDLYDFVFLSYAIPTFNFPIVGRRFFVKKGLPILSLNLARFNYMYANLTEKSQYFVSFVTDDDFLTAIRSIYIERLGSSLEQVFYPGDLQLKQLEQDIRSGKLPPCMMRLVREMYRMGHLQHLGRLYLQLFLKDAGMNMQDVIDLFQQYFTYNGKMSIDKFNKEYGYNIKHVYGKVGQGGKSHCFGCEKIIEMVPSVGYVHGCPFRVLTPQYFAGMYCKDVKQLDIEDIIREIYAPIAAKSYTSACNHLFYRLYGSGMKYPHPIQWISTARELEEANPVILKE